MVIIAKCKAMHTEKSTLQFHNLLILTVKEISSGVRVNNYL